MCLSLALSVCASDRLLQHSDSVRVVDCCWFNNDLDHHNDQRVEITTRDCAWSAFWNRVNYLCVCSSVLSNNRISSVRPIRMFAVAATTDDGIGSISSNNNDVIDDINEWEWDENRFIAIELVSSLRTFSLYNIALHVSHSRSFRSSACQLIRPSARPTVVARPSLSACDLCRCMCWNTHTHTTSHLQYWIL